MINIDHVIDRFVDTNDLDLTLLLLKTLASPDQGGSGSGSIHTTLGRTSTDSVSTMAKRSSGST